MAEVENIIRYYDNIKQLKRDFENPWERCREYAMPYAPYIYGGSQPTPGSVSTNNYDSTAAIALRNLASVLLANTTSPTSRWVQFQTDDELKQDIADQVENVVSEALEDTNAYAELFAFYKNLAGYGTAVMWIGEAPTGRDMYFKTLHIGDVAIAEDYMGIVDTVYREIIITLRELKQMFPEEGALSDKAEKKLENNPFEEITIIHCVMPRTDADREMTDAGEFKFNKLSLPYAEYWIEEEAKHMISEGGFRTFPFIVARWEKEPGRIYGHGPVMDALADIKQLNRAERSKIELAEKLNNPPKLFIGGEPDDWDTTPGAKNVVDEDTKMLDIITGANFPISDNAVQEKRMAVNEALYVNQFQGLDRRNEKEMTAREVHAIEMESLRILGPTAHRIQKSIERMLFRILDILEQHGKLPTDEEGNPKVNIFSLRFINAISRAQRTDELNAVNYLVGKIYELANLKPDTMDLWDFDKIANSIFEATGLPMNFKNKPRIVAEIRAQKAQQGQTVEQMQMAGAQGEIQETQAKAAEKMSRVRKNDREGGGI